jgi:hypothetical protein
LVVAVALVLGVAAIVALVFKKESNVYGIGTTLNN